MRYAGSAHAIELGRLANENPPKLRTHDRYGNRVDEVEFHPAWHELLGASVEHELHSLPWREPVPGAHVARGAAFMCFGQAEAGVGCPISMTYSVIPRCATSPSWPPSGSPASSPTHTTGATPRRTRSRARWPAWG